MGRNQSQSYDFINYRGFDTFYGFWNGGPVSQTMPKIMQRK